MTDQEDNINLGKMSLTTTIKRGNFGPFGTNLVQIADCVSVPTFCHFVDQLRLLLDNSHSKTCDESTLSVGILNSAAGYVLPSRRL